MSGQLYRHYKGGFYRFQFEARMEADQQRVIVYQAMATGDVWVRPREDFFGTVHDEALGGAAVRRPRFWSVSEEEYEQSLRKEPSHALDRAIAAEMRGSSAAWATGV